jgi:cyclomaltodextrinase / maltogenic alpha-amylase / neopullulanase
MAVPAWVQDAVFYQIFPDRFANGDPSIDPPNVQPWGTAPTRWGFQGGDLAGITQKIDYLVDLGINAIYLNPIFMAASTHRYDTRDYFRIDPKLGSLADFHRLIETAHRSGIRVILDGVFNHCGRSFFAFSDVLENEKHSPYLDWYHIKKFPLQAYTRGEARNYKGWWDHKSLPKFNTDNPYVRRYLLDVSRYWIEQGADGWRLDVPNEIDDDSFWAEFRQIVRAANPEAYLLGEIWDTGPRWLGENHFDGLMNYPVRAAILDLLTKKIDAAEFGQRVEKALAVYERENVYAMFLLVGSHDTERVLTMLGSDWRKVRLAYLFQFAYPGAPAVYYGDEIGMEGGKDPDCRRAFPWHASEWNNDLLQSTKTLIAARKAHQALRQGDYRPLLASKHPSAYAFARTLGEEIIIIAMNPSSAAVELQIPAADLGLEEGCRLRSLLGSGETVVQNGTLSVHLDPWAGDYLK